MNIQSLDSDLGRSVLRMERPLPHPVHAVWRALTDRAMLARWFPADLRIDDPMPGGKVVFDFGSGERAMIGMVTDFDPPRLLAYTWEGDHLRWQVRPGALTLAHTFDDRAGAASFAAGWHTCLRILAAELAGRPAPEAEDTAELHDAFVNEFGLDEPEFGPGSVRLERQLTRSAELVWRELTAGQQVRADGPVPAGFTCGPIPAGNVAEVEPERRLLYYTPDGTVAWELGEGTGQGARLVLTHSGTSAAGRELAASAWREHLRQLAERLRRLPADG
ncbi:SRPBCC domain-containing protein [Nonomuraea dietziae]|uniref:SRPBCC domain-containing protein n=1 Tax=Nonomuraea dietziae TaxID=65515 RepID=UPI003429E852